MSNNNRNGGIDPNDIASIVQNIVTTVADAIGSAASGVASSLGKDNSFFKDLHLNTDETEGHEKEKKQKTYYYNYSEQANAEKSSEVKIKTNADNKRRGLHPAIKYAIAAVLGFVSATCIASAVYTTAFAVMAAVSGAFLAAGTGFAISGALSESRYRLSGRYHRLIGKSSCASVPLLAKRVDKKPSKVRKELQTLIDIGYFGTDAYIDMQNDSIVLDPAAFAEKCADETKKASAEKADDSHEPSDEYDKWLYRIAEANRKIEDTAVTRRVDIIGLYASKIFDYVKVHPEASGQIRSFMNYYLPLTLKLLQSYDMIEEAGVAGDNMRTTKENIESTLDTLCAAYRK